MNPDRSMLTPLLTLTRPQTRRGPGPAFAPLKDLVLKTDS